MSATWAIFKRELKSLWVTPLAWVLLTTFLLLQGGIFYSIVAHFATLGQDAASGDPLSAYFGKQSLLMSFTLLLLCPSLTMRCLAEERKTGNMDCLLSAPVASWSIVLGKYLGCLATYCFIWAPTGLYAHLLRDSGLVDSGALLSSYLGLLLVGASYLGIGVLMSSLSHNQLVSLLLTSAALFALFVLGIGEYIFAPGPLRDLCGYVSLTTLLEEMSKGLIDSRRVVLHGSIAVWTLFVCTRVVSSWRTG